MNARLHEWTDLAGSWVPNGRNLSESHWRHRHKAMLWVLWLHLPLLFVVGVVSDHEMVHVAPYVAVLGLGALLAGTAGFGRRTRTVLAVLTLVSCSAVLVHLTDGLTESHFHFFAVVAFITLYQEWLPFAVTLIYVVVHHGVVGVLFPRMVYSHEDAWNQPVLWAFIHGGYVILASLAGMAAWRLAEIEREKVERVLDAAGDGIYGVDASGQITFVNPMLCEILGQEKEALVGMDQHVALGHVSSEGIPLDPAECPLCEGAAASRQGTGQANLRDSRGAALPVEFVVRPARDAGRERGGVVTVRDLRERRALEAERDRLASIAEGATDLTVIGRADGQMIWMNGAGRTMLGFDPAEDITAYRIEDLFSPEEMARVYADDMPVIAREGDWQGEWTLRRRNGAKIPVSVTVHVHGDSGGQSGYVSAIMRDLRPQRAQERVLRESERRLTTAEGVARLGSWEWDPSRDSVIWSPGMYRLHGMEAGDGNETFDSWVRTLHPDGRETAIDQAGQALSNGTGVDFTYRAVRTDGRGLVIHSRGEMMPGRNGEAMTMVGTLLDITEQHAASEALRQSEELARSVIATAGDAYVQCGADSIIAEWNDKAESVFGWTRQEAIGRSFSSLLLAPQGRDPFERRVGLRPDAASDLPPSERFELTMVHRSGSEIPVELTAWAIRTAGVPIFSFFIRDVSERQAAERAKNEFVSVVGHELRTPLTSIHGALGLLRAGLLGELNDRGKHMVDIAAHNTDRLVRLINDILDIERLNSGKVSLDRQECDIAVLAKRSVDAMRPMAELAGVRLELDTESGAVWADPDRIEQTLTNLLSNAIKFSPQGAPVRLVSRTRGEGVEVQVRDQGRGIPPEHLELIFDRFQQVDGSDAREKGGTGLGLAICRTIIEQHRGRIWASSAIGDGATLTFTLPGAGFREDPMEGGGPKVLICADDASVRSAVSAMLLPHGYEVVEVTSGARLQEAAVAHRPAVILLDLRMPAVAGWQAAAALRDETQLHDIPVVVLSLEGEKTAVNLPEVVDRLESPFDADTLVAAVGQAISSRALGPTLLLVEDDEDLADVLTERFRQLGIEVHHAPTAQRALAMCAHIVPDLLVLDLWLPDQDGFAVVAQLRRDARLRGMPLAVYTASDLSEADRKRLRLGTTRFFTKGRISSDQFERNVLDLLGQLTYKGEELHA